MNTRKLVVWDAAWAPYISEFESRLESGWRVVAGADNIEWLKAEIEDASALLALRMPLDALPHARGLKVLLYPGAGVLETDSAQLPEGCVLVNVYEHEGPIAEYTLMMMLAHATALRAHLDSFREGHWDGSGRLGGQPHGELAGRTVGLFGYGRIGQAVALRARAFGMKVAAVRRNGNRPMATAVEPDFVARADKLDRMLPRADFLVIAAPLTEETRNRIGEREIDLLPSGAFLVNVSRAEIVNEQDLYRALESGRLAGAALDVWYRYPRAGETGHGSRFPFHELPNVYCTPHYAAWSRDMILRRIAGMCETLNRLNSGMALERVVLTGTWRP